MLQNLSRLLWTWRRPWILSVSTRPAKFLRWHRTWNPNRYDWYAFLTQWFFSWKPVTSYFFFQFHTRSLTTFENFPTVRDRLNDIQCMDFSPSSGYMCLGCDNGRACLYRLLHYSNYWSAAKKFDEIDLTSKRLEKVYWHVTSRVQRLTKKRSGTVIEWTDSNATTEYIEANYLIIS